MVASFFWTYWTRGSITVVWVLSRVCGWSCGGHHCCHIRRKGDSSDILQALQEIHHPVPDVMEGLVEFASKMLCFIQHDPLHWTREVGQQPLVFCEPLCVLCIVHVGTCCGFNWLHKYFWLTAAWLCNMHSICCLCKTLIVYNSHWTQPLDPAQKCSSEYGEVEQSYRYPS